MNSWEETQARISAENIAYVKREIEQATKAAEAKAKADPFRAERMHFLMLLIRARLKKKVSQAELAAMLNMPQSTIARLESGHGNPTLKTLLAIAKALDVDLMLEYKQ
jgi:ribosome-binding protein aMBF1 (putative translation factor)